MKNHVRYGSCPNYNSEVSQATRRIDHQVWKLGGKTSVSHSCITRRNRGDDRTSLRRRIIELNRENGSLQHEDKYFTTLANEVLVSLKVSIQSCLSKIPGSLLHDDLATRHVGEMGSSISEAFERQRPHTDPFMGLNKQKTQHRGFANALDPQVNLLSSWVQGARNRPLPPTPSPMSRSVLETLEIDLIRQNGMMRQSIALNRKLVYRVLLRLVSQMHQLASALRSIVTDVNLFIEQLNTDWRQYIEDVVKEETDPEAQDLDIVLTCSSDARYIAGTMDNRSDSRLRESDLSLTYDSDKVESVYSSLGILPINQGRSNTRGSNDNQDQSWPYVEPLRIAHQQSQPFLGCGAVPSKAKLRQRLAMLHYERMYYRRLANEALVRFIPTIKHHVHENQNLLHDYSTEENRLRCLLHEQISIRTTQVSESHG